MKILRFAAKLFREDRLRFTLTLLAATVVGLLEGVSIALMVPLLQMMQGGPSAANGFTAGIVAGFLAFLHIPFTLGWMLSVILGVVIIQQAFNLVYQKLFYGSAFRYESRVRQRLYDAIMAARWPYFVKNKLGHLVSGLTVEANSAGEAYWAIILFFTQAIVIAVYTALALTLSWQMTMLSVVGIAGVFIALRPRMSRASGMGREIMVSSADLQSEAVEEIGGAKLIKSTATEGVAIDRFAVDVAEVARSKYRNAMNAALVRILFEPVSVSMLCAGIYLAVAILNVPLEKIIVFLFIFYRLAPRVTNMQQQMHATLSFSGGLTKVEEMTAEAEGMRETTSGAPAQLLRNRVRLEKVSFAYEGDHRVLCDVDVDIPRGRTVAIVGPSGAGKSTINDVVLGLITPDEGKVTIDGRDLRELDVTSWRSRAGYVAQEAVLFHATVRENLTWTAPGADAAAVERAVEIAYADEFIRELPEGFDTVIGDRGTRLSGGQRQRLALARALVREPEVLILDEATSALDAESEEKIQHAISALTGKMTIIVITHRLATVRGADYIYFLDHGRIVEEGTWDELSGRDGEFHRMMELQELGGQQPA